MNLDELSAHRRRTEAVSGVLLRQLRGHLETLKPLLTPQRLLGKHAGGKAEVPGADRALAQLQEQYKGLPAQPYNLSRDLDPQCLSSVGDDLQLHPWEYSHQATTPNGAKLITMTSPLCWVVTFASQYTLSQFRLALSGREPRRLEHLRQFVVNALVAHLLFASHPGLTRLFADLRYEVAPRVSEEMPKLPLTTLNGCLRSLRPADDLILAATAFSGVPAFIELADPASLSDFPDPLRVKVAEAMT